MANDPSSKGGSTAADRKRAALPESVRQGLEVTEMDNELAGLRARFEQFFMGLEKRSPAPDCEEYKKRLLRLKGGFIRNTAVRFRVNALHQKFMAYERLWLKTLKEIEEGTYRRDLFKLRRKKSLADNQGPGPKSKAAAAPAADSIDDLDVNLDDFNEEAAPPAPVAAPASPPPAPKPAAAPPPAARPVVAQPPAAPPPAARPVVAQPPVAPPPASKPSVAPPPAAVRTPVAAGSAARPPAGPAESKPASATVSNVTAPGAPKPVAPKPSASLSLSSGAAAKPTPSITLTSGLGARPVAPRTVSQPAAPAAAPAKPPAPRTVSQPGVPAASSAPRPGAPARPASPPAAPRPAGGSSDPLSKERVQAIYDAYVTAKRQCKENTSGLTYDAVAQSLQKQVPKLMQQPGVKSVDFKVVIKDGKAVLKAVTKQ